MRPLLRRTTMELCLLLSPVPRLVLMILRSSMGRNAWLAHTHRTSTSLTSFVSRAPMDKASIWDPICVVTPNLTLTPKPHPITAVEICHSSRESKAAQMPLRSSMANPASSVLCLPTSTSRVKHAASAQMAKASAQLLKAA